MQNDKTRNTEKEIRLGKTWLRTEASVFLKGMYTNSRYCATILCIIQTIPQHHITKWNYVYIVIGNLFKNFSFSRRVSCIWKEIRKFVIRNGKILKLHGTFNKIRTTFLRDHFYSFSRFFCLKIPPLIRPFLPQFSAKLHDFLACYRITYWRYKVRWLCWNFGPKLSIFKKRYLRLENLIYILL